MDIHYRVLTLIAPLAVAACGSDSGTSNQNDTVNAAAIAADAARMSADEMHNEMSDANMSDQPMRDDTMNQHHAMGGMTSGAASGGGNMQGMSGGTTMGNQQEKGKGKDQPMSMEDDM